MILSGQTALILTLRNPDKSKMGAS